MYAPADVDTLFRIPLFTDGPWFFAPVQMGTPPQTFNLMFDTGSSLSWIQTTGCFDSPTLCNNSPKFNASSSTTVRFQPEKIAVRYTEGVISTQVVSDVVTLGLFSTTGSSNSTVLFGSNSTASATTISAAATTPPPTTTITTKTKRTTATTTSRASRNTFYPHTTMGSTNSTSRAREATAITRDATMKETNDRFRSVRSFGLTTDVSGDLFLLTKETDVSGFLGASQNRFESESDFSTHFFADMVRELPQPVFSLAFTETWGTLTLGGPDPAFFSEPLYWVKTLPDEAGWVTRLAPRIELIPLEQESSSAGDVDYVMTDIDRIWFDSGTTYIWGDESAIRPLNEWIGADPATGQVDCTSIPLLGNIVFSIGGSDGETELRLELSPTEYIIGKSTSRKCFSALNASSSGKNHWIFGLQLLRGFYTVYHYGYGLVGIAPYNITITNPVGTVTFPGSHAILDKDVQETLDKISAETCSAARTPVQPYLSWWLLGMVFAIMFFQL